MMQSANALADLFIGGGHTLAGTEIVEPGLHDEGFVEVFGIGGVAIDAPADSTVTQSDAAQFVNGVGEFGVIFGGDTIVDGDANGASGVEVVGGP